MPYISTFVYAEDSNAELTPQGQKLHIINPQQIFLPMFVPGMFSFAVAFGILEVNTQESHRIRYVFYSPVEGELPLIDTGEVVLPIVTEDNGVPIDMQGIMLNLNFRNVPFRLEGAYKSEIYLDGNLLGIFPIKVRGKERNES